MTQIIKPQEVIDIENEKQLISNGFQDYCTKLCPDRYKKITGERQCFCAFNGVEIRTSDDTLDKQKYLQITCTVESDSSEYSGGYTSIQRSIDIKELGKLYDKEKI